MADAQRTVELLTSTAAEKKIDTDNNKACYFKAHARALELAIDRRATGIDLNSICDDAPAYAEVRISHRWCSSEPSGDSISERHEQTSTTSSPLGKDYNERDIRDRECGHTHCYTAERDACCDDRKD